MHPDVAGAGLNAHGGAAAVELTGYVVAIGGTLGEHLAVGVDAARTAFGVERERRIADPELDVAGTGSQLPADGGRARDLDVAGAGLSFERAMDVLQFDAARAGPGLYVAGARLLRVDVA